MKNFQKLLMIICGFYTLNSFGQVTKNQDLYTFKQGWEIKKDYLYTGKICLENVNKEKKIPLFAIKLDYKIHPLSYKNNILTAKAENLLTKKQQTITIDILKGTLLSKKDLSIFTLFNGIWPNKPIQTGDKWTKTAQNTGHLNQFFETKSISWNYIFKGIEQIQKIPCAKIEIKINTVPNTKSQGSGTAWINLKDGLINQLELNFTKILSKPTPTGVTQHLMKVTVQRTK